MIGFTARGAAASAINFENYLIVRPRVVSLFFG